MIDPRRKRQRMVREQLQARGIVDLAVLRAMGHVPRHRFVQEALADQAYDDKPLPIGLGQTISQPYIVALMSDLLAVRRGIKVLEIGTGSGYQAAILAELGADVYTVERIPELFRATRELLGSLGYLNIKCKLDDGTLGWPQFAPFERIIVTAGGPEVPEPLVAQLADPGMLLIPVGGSRRSQTLVQILKKGGQTTRVDHGGVVFVDLVGAHGW